MTGNHSRVAGGDPFARLLRLAESLGLVEDDRVALLLHRVISKRDERAADKLTRELTRDALAARLAPDPFRSHERAALDGPFQLGHTTDGHPVGLHPRELNRHVLVSGQSGTGKTNLLKRLVTQARTHGVHLVHFDRKGDLDHAAREGVDALHWSEFRLNPLCPPHPGVHAHEWRNDLAKVIAELFEFWTRGHAILLRGVDHLLSTNRQPCPTLRDLRQVFAQPRFAKTIRGRGRESLYSIIDKLDSIILELGPIIDCHQGISLEQLVRERRVVNLNLDGLSVEFQNYLIVSLLIAYAHLLKTTGPRGQLNAILAFDEAKGLFSKRHENFLVADLVSKVREWGIGLVCADQVPSALSQAFLSNIGTLVMLRHSDGHDLRHLQQSAGATPAQIQANYTLQPGEAIIRLQKSKDLHRITIPYEPADKFITRAERETLMRSRVAALHENAIPATPPAPTTTTPAADEQARRLLTEIATNPDRPCSAVYECIGLTNSQGHRLKTRLRKQGALSQVRTNLGKGGKRAVYLVPNPTMLDKLGIKYPDEGRGGVLHRYFQQELQRQCHALGYDATIEENRTGTGEAPDLGLHKDGQRVAVEIIVTTKPAANVASITKCRRLGYDTVILAFVNAQLLASTSERAKATLAPHEYEAARFCLLHHVTNHLEGQP